ncbi:MAG: DUF349 domain-containing protein [Myxococcales bacterium]|nr:DUF349 domain-containing protein [Myxococcales bacterium]
MGLVDLFRPKYRHSDVAVRAEAVRALSADDAVILTTIAKSDRDPGIRKIAIEKLGQAEVLAELASAEADGGVRALATARAAELWRSTACGGDADAANKALTGILKTGDQGTLVEIVVRAAIPAIKKRALSELRDPRALAELAKSDASAELRLDAVSRIDDAEALRALAIDVALKEIALAALDKLDDAGRLEQVAQKAKNKAARQRARKILTEMKEAEEAARPRVADDLKRRRAEKSQLVRDLEALGDTFEFARYAPQVKAAEAAFAELGETEDDAGERFRRAATRFWQRKELAERQAEQAQTTRRDSAERSARPSREARDEHDDRKTRDDSDAKAEAKADAKPLDPEAAAAAALAREERERKRAEAAAKAKEDADARAAKAKEDAERGQQIAASLTAMIGEMEQVLAADTAALEGGKVIDRTLQQAQKAFEQLGKVPSELRNALGERYGAARGKLVVLVKDLREAEDWQRWANVPRAEALIQEAKSMLELEETPELGAKLKSLQARWKEVGSLPQRRSKELWEQFKASCDQVYDKVKGVRAVEQAAFAELAAAKEKLIAEAESLAESTDWQATAERLKGLQGQWKTSGHLPRKQGDELWKRFRAACDRFFERRKPLLEAQRNQEQQNLAAKRALITKVTSLVSSLSPESDWGKAIRDVKEAQRVWKDIGFVPRAEADLVYREFRAACDTLFAKRGEARDAEANARRAALEGVSAELDAVMAMTEASEGADAAARAAAVRAKVSELSADGSRPSIELAGRLDRLVAHVITHFPEAVRGTPLDPSALRKRRDVLIARAAELVPKESAAAGSKSDDVAGALRVAMRQNAFSGLRFSGRDPAEVIYELRAEWAETGPLFDDSDRDQKERFEATIAKVVASVGITERQRDDASAGDGTDPSEGGRRRRERPEREARSERGEREARPERSERPERVERGEQQEPAAAAAVTSAAEAAPQPAAPAPDLAATAPRRAAPRTEPPTSPQDDAWDLDDHRPQTAEPAPSPPGAGEMAGDGAPEGDGIDTGWD